jgi:hypothetical protein
MSVSFKRVGIRSNGSNWVQLGDYQLHNEDYAHLNFYCYNIHLYDKLFTYYP